MTPYNVVLFAHITAVMVMFACLTADWLAIIGLRAAEAARAWKHLKPSAVVGPWARLSVLGAGLYLAVDGWSWQGWINRRARWVDSVHHPWRNPLLAKSFAK